MSGSHSRRSALRSPKPSLPQMQNHNRLPRRLQTPRSHHLFGSITSLQHPHNQTNQLCPTRRPNNRVVYRCPGQTCLAGPASVESNRTIQRPYRLGNRLCARLKRRTVPRFIPLLDTSPNDATCQTPCNGQGRLVGAIRTSIHVRCS